MESLQGKLLISGGGLFDANFRHTVVLIARHDEAGAVGVILNRRMEVAVAEAVPALADLVEPGDRLFEGGPVEPDQPVLLVEASFPGLVDVPVLGSIGFLTGDVPEDVRPAILRARVFAGHAGWGPGQLEAELAADAWIVEPATDDDVFSDAPDTLWRRILERKARATQPLRESRSTPR